jgi:hypothetical protein
LLAAARCCLDAGQSVVLCGRVDRTTTATAAAAAPAEPTFAASSATVAMQSGHILVSLTFPARSSCLEPRTIVRGGFRQTGQKNMNNGDGR